MSADASHLIIAFYMYCRLSNEDYIENFMSEIKLLQTARLPVIIILSVMVDGFSPG